MKYAHSNSLYLSLKLFQNIRLLCFFFEFYSDSAIETKKDSAARGGFIIFHRSVEIVHPISQLSRKIRRVARSSGPRKFFPWQTILTKCSTFLHWLRRFDAHTIWTTVQIIVAYFSSLLPAKSRRSRWIRFYWLWYDPWSKTAIFSISSG